MRSARADVARRSAVGSTTTNSSPTEAAHKVLGTNASGQEGCGFAQHGVPGLVTVGIVEFLEVIQVEHQDAHGLFGANGAADFAIKHLLQVAAIVESREWILGGLRPQRFAK